MGGSSYCRGPPKSAAMDALRFDTKGATATAAEVTALDRGPAQQKGEFTAMRCTRVHRVGVLTAMLALLPLAGLVPSAWAQNPPPTPADKIQVSASTIEVMDSTQPQPVTLLSVTFRTSTPADLLIRFTGECALFTDVMSPDGNSKANVKVWVELDGVPVPVTSDPAQGGPDDGKVVFCNREVQLTSPDVIDLFLRTRESHAFQWGALNVGNQIHTLEVKAQLDVLVTGGGAAEAAVGKRVLIMEPVHLEHDAAF